MSQRPPEFDDREGRGPCVRCHAAPVLPTPVGRESALAA
jgi:hypothetical protein